MIWRRLLDALEERTTFRPTWASLGRIAIWFVAALVVFAVVVPDRPGDPAESPYRGQISSPEVFEIGAPRGDERGFYPTDPTDDQFRIAWIAGSSIQGVDPEHRTFLPGELRHDLHTIDGREVTIDIFFLSGMRIVDEYAAVLQAIESEPDMIVVTLNPFWMLNDRAVQGWDNLDARLLSDAITAPGSWPLVGSLVSPSDALWAAAGQRADVFEDRYHWGLRLTDRFGDSTLLDIEPADEDAELSELDEIAAMQIPVFFWDKYDNLAGDDVTGAERQAAPFIYVARTRPALPRAAVGGIVDALADSEIPAYLYVAQLNDELLAADVVDRSLAEVEAYLAEIVDGKVGDHMTVRTESAIRTVGDMDFRDAIHAFDVGPLTRHLYAELCDFVASEGWEASCE